VNGVVEMNFAVLWRHARGAFFDPKRSYYENWEEGPFNGFADGVVFPPEKPPKFKYLGYDISYPLGIAAGPLLEWKICESGDGKRL
jgi:hypothetical protein